MVDSRDIPNKSSTTSMMDLHEILDKSSLTSTVITRNILDKSSPTIMVSMQGVIDKSNNASMVDTHDSFDKPDYTSKVVICKDSETSRTNHCLQYKHCRLNSELERNLIYEVDTFCVYVFHGPESLAIISQAYSPAQAPTRIIKYLGYNHINWVSL